MHFLYFFNEMLLGSGIFVLDLSEVTHFGGNSFQMANRERRVCGFLKSKVWIGRDK